MLHPLFYEESTEEYTLLLIKIEDYQTSSHIFLEIGLSNWSTLSSLLNIGESGSASLSSNFDIAIIDSMESLNFTTSGLM